ncbi:histidine--tRNA ligase [Spiroplasma endosymbiont of Amphibalanus improvisus]|uniref:histidine--tRNA ligase n=1 Tax=Spiroplasma endosymbiont of Amphibalanus improvisus TaxID=3066327 RepID=UPI00313EEE8D
MMQITKPRGTEDWFYERAEQFMILSTIIRNLIYKYNYKEIMTPIFESKDLFVRSVGDTSDVVSKEMFEFLDKKHRAMVLRPEATAATIRAILENNLHNKYELPLKQFYIGPMFRYERPQKGRLRQFHQFGIECVGSKSPYLDVEIITIMWHLLSYFEIKNCRLKINFLGDQNTIKKYTKDLVKTVSKLLLCDDCKSRIKNNPLRLLDCKKDQKQFQNLPSILNYLSSGQKTYFQTIQNLLTELKIAFVVDHKLVRGLDYYNDFVFEFVQDTDEGEFTICGGGRYDTLVNQLEKNQNLPAIGFALGIERLLLLLEKNNVHLTSPPMIDVYVISLSKAAKLWAHKIMLDLRREDYIVDCDFMDRNIKSQFKSSERKGAMWTLIIGDDEIKQNKINIKNQTTKLEHSIPISELINFLNQKKEQTDNEKNT